MLARYDANDTVPLEWVLNLPSVSISRLFLVDFDLFWNSRVDQISLIIWFQSSLCIQIEPLLMQFIIFMVFLSDITLLSYYKLESTAGSKQF